VVVTVLLLWTIIRIFADYSSVRELLRPARILLVLLFIQLGLGFAAYLTRVEWGKDTPQPVLSMVLATVAHVAVGALVLATSVVLAAQAYRHASPQAEAAIAHPAQTRVMA